MSHTVQMNARCNNVTNLVKDPFTSAVFLQHDNGQLENVATKVFWYGVVPK